MLAGSGASGFTNCCEPVTELHTTYGFPMQLTHSQTDSYQPPFPATSSSSTASPIYISLGGGFSCCHQSHEWNQEKYSSESISWTIDRWHAGLTRRKSHWKAHLDFGSRAFRIRQKSRKLGSLRQVLVPSILPICWRDFQFSRHMGFVARCQLYDQFNSSVPWRWLRGDRNWFDK